ncbi:hypothetical protein JRG18_12610 [Kocuria palustris]|uniref:hypothetical protein n=1 Tax=Kocuria palustris TaxID=71999 RepID=UPI0019D28168|nr:hypothetical protein [Kocuria palustris]MBN6754330.1 hypothetical protein [Kocuria palustris]MBN6759295.1 hypothetical protein [Kocuria palustris]MBN6764311.1 hypothetical protein [Kocuria palustris]MBN6783806.1 hypothetical protein [Kocuria palustris]MBN6800278.1 hypothetical protein [Kocuria palustris]
MTTFDSTPAPDPSTAADFALDHTATAEDLPAPGQAAGTDAIAARILAETDDWMAAQDAIDAFEEAETLRTLHRSTIALPPPAEVPEATVTLELITAIRPVVDTGIILAAVLQTEHGLSNSRIALGTDHHLVTRAAATIHGESITWGPRERG